MKKMKGYCNVQLKEYEIYVDTIDTTAAEDRYKNYILGRTSCGYAATHNDIRCNICSVKENGVII